MGGHDCQGVGTLWASTGTSTRESRFFCQKVGYMIVGGGGGMIVKGRDALCKCWDINS